MFQRRRSDYLICTPFWADPSPPRMKGRSHSFFCPQLALSSSSPRKQSRSPKRNSCRCHTGGHAWALVDIKHQVGLEKPTWFHFCFVCLLFFIYYFNNNVKKKRYPDFYPFVESTGGLVLINSIQFDFISKNTPKSSLNIFIKKINVFCFSN